MIGKLVLGAAGAAFVAAIAFAQGDEEDPWWDPNEGRVFPAQLDYRNPNGTLRLLLDNGPMETKDHPFFTAIGPNGRACVTCHQPADAMSLSAASAAQQWAAQRCEGPVVRGIRRVELPELAAGQARVALATDRPWPDPHRPALATQGREAGLHDRGGARSVDLQSRRQIWSQGCGDGVGIPPPPPGRQFQIYRGDGVCLRPQGGNAVAGRPGDGQAGQREPDGRWPGADAGRRRCATRRGHISGSSRISTRTTLRASSTSNGASMPRSRPIVVGGALDGDGSMGGTKTLQVSQAGRLGSDGGDSGVERVRGVGEDAQDGEGEAVARGPRLPQSRSRAARGCFATRPS